MASEREETTLGAEVDLLTGFPFKSERYTDSEDSIRLVRGDNIVQGSLRWDGAKKWPLSESAEHEIYQLREGDVVLAMDRPWIEAGLKYAAISRYDLPCLLVQRTARLRGGPKLDIGFLRYLVGSGEFTQHILSVITGTAVPHISGKQIRDFPFARRSLPEQRAIAGVLGALDDEIESNRRTSRTLEKLARAIFRAWFVDFEPVKAKAAGARFFPSMPQGIFDALPTRLVPSELGPIPEGWGVGEVADMAALSREAVNPQEYPEEVFDHLSIPAFDDSQRPAVEPGTAIKSNKLLVTADCVLVSKLNPRIPRVWLPPAPGQHRQIASTEFLVTLPTPGWPRSYIYCLVQQREFVDDMAQRASGTSNSHQRVKPDDYLRTRAVLPPESIRSAFGDAAWPLLNYCRSMALENTRLATLRDYLLPKLLSGAVRAGRVDEVD